MLPTCHTSKQSQAHNAVHLRIFILEGAEELDDLGVSGGVWFVKSHMGANI